MGKLYFYTIFHANLSFSSIPPDQYSVILDKCYWPVVDLVSKGYKLGLEFSATTLDILNEIDPYFVEEISDLWMNGKCDIIGSSLIQGIFPLIPEEVNTVNLREGQNEYIRLLGACPELGFINEQTYSRAVPYLFEQTGYRAFIMDWDNASEFHDFDPHLRYRPALVRGVNDTVMPVVWNSSLNSYKFQRYIYNRLSMDEFISSVLAHEDQNHDRALVLYGTDWEIFDYRPGTQEEVSGEVDKIERILRKLTSHQNVELVTPSQILDLFPPQDEICIESPECPVPCKNRDDYNVVRWAVSGRDNVHLNTECYRNYYKLKELDFFNGLSGSNKLLWNSLAELWGSDLRTKTTDEKHYSGKLKLGELAKTLDKKRNKIYDRFVPKYDFLLINPFQEDIIAEPFELDLSFTQGEKRGELGIEIDGELAVSQCEYQELYRDGSIRRACFVVIVSMQAGYAAEGRIVELSKVHTNRFRRYNGDKLRIETQSTRVTLAARTGADIRELNYPSVSPDSLVGYLPPVYYDHIGHSSDYYSGGIQACDSFGTVIHDTVAATVTMPEELDAYPVRIPIVAEMNLGSGKLWKTFYVYRSHPRLDVRYRFYFSDLTPIFFRIGLTTLNPEAFDKASLSFSTTNGSHAIEKFYPAGRKMQHQASVGSFSSSRTCIGATDGWIDISDKDKGIAMYADKSALYSVPMVEYEEIKKSYLMRVYHSISESDETGRIHWRGHNTAQLSYIGHAGSIEKTLPHIRHAAQRIICIPKRRSRQRSDMTNPSYRHASAFPADCAV